MAAPVYFQNPTVGNRPFGRLDAQGRVIPSSYDDMAYQADLDDGDYIVYAGYARPGASTEAAVWQIRKYTYSSSTVVGITWPEDVNGAASNDYEFVWADRADYTYS